MPLKVGRSPSSKMFCLLQWKPFKYNKKCFLFHLKTSLRSQDICIFGLTFWSCRENGLIRKMRLISEFMMPQPGQQSITIHILPNISQSKGKHIIKFGQVEKYNKKNIFLQKSCRKYVRETSSRPLCILKKMLYEVKTSGLHLVSIYFDSPQVGMIAFTS